jgi:hypothetical protein
MRRRRRINLPQKEWQVVEPSELKVRDGQRACHSWNDVGIVQHGKSVTHMSKLADASICPA